MYKMDIPSIIWIFSKPANEINPETPYIPKTHYTLRKLKPFRGSDFKASLLLSKESQDWTHKSKFWQTCLSTWNWFEFLGWASTALESIPPLLLFGTIGRISSKVAFPCFISISYTSCVGKHGNDDEPTPNGMIRLEAVEFLPAWTFARFLWLTQTCCVGEHWNRCLTKSSHDSIWCQPIQKVKKASVLILILILILILAANVQYTQSDLQTPLGPTS